MKIGKSVVAALIISTGVSAPALAAMGASAAITGLHYELIDLRPDDGIDPWVDWSTSAVGADRWSSAFARASNRCNSRPECGARNTTTKAFGPVLAQGQADGAATFASVSQAGIFSAISNSLDIKPGVRKSIEAGAGMLGYSDGLMRLAPHTAIKFTGHYSLDAWIDPEPEQEDISKSSFAYLKMNFWSSKVFEAIGVTSSGEVTRAHKTGDFVWQLQNRRDFSHVAYASIGTYASGGAYHVSSIPEPSTYAMMAAGLGILGVVARKRQKDKISPSGEMP